MSEYKQSIVDDLDDVIRFARGIEAAICGLECLNDRMKEGVIELLLGSIDRLKHIRERAVAECLECAQEKRPSAGGGKSA